MGIERLKANRGLIANRIALNDDDGTIRAALTGMMSETTTITRPELVDYLLDICEQCDLGINNFVKSVATMVIKRETPAETIVKRVKRLTVKSFMDAWTLNLERLQQCCVHVGSIDGESNPLRIPFCARQLFKELRDKTSYGQVRINEVIPAERLARARR